MTAEEYRFIRYTRPELGFKRWSSLPPRWRALVEKLTPERLIARRTAVLLGREMGTTDSYDFPPDLPGLPEENV
jgi:hypothetical protein